MRIYMLSGDAMEIEDDDSNSNSKIYVNTPMAAPSSHTHSTHIPHRPSLLSQFTQPVGLCLHFSFCSFIYYILPRKIIFTQNVKESWNNNKIHVSCPLMNSRELCLGRKTKFVTGIWRICQESSDLVNFQGDMKFKFWKVRFFFLNVLQKCGTIFQFFGMTISYS